MLKGEEQQERMWVRGSRKMREKGERGWVTQPHGGTRQAYLVRSAPLRSQAGTGSRAPLGLRCGTARGGI